jgi:hydroxymethylglutaryl-CoA reductase (NADPH)
MNSIQDDLSRFVNTHGPTVAVSIGVYAILSYTMNVLTSQSVTEVELKVTKGPRPNWAILTILNYVVMAIFVGSIGFAIANYKNQSTSSMSNANDDPTSPMFYIAVVWSMCLAYFFGFFGISFLDKDALSASPSTFGLSDLQTNESIENSNNNNNNNNNNNKRDPLTPMNDAPICAERNLFCAKKETTEMNSNPLVNAPAMSNSTDFTTLSDDEILALVLSGSLKDHQLEKKLGDMERAVCIRRKLYEKALGKNLDLIPYAHYDYNKVFGANCEIVVGYVPLPVGIVGPIKINSEPCYVPMATTEGCLVASTNRGCKAITQSGGCQSVLLKDAITRAPCVRLPSAARAALIKKWCESPEGYQLIEIAFNSTTNYGRLDSLDVTVAGKNAYLRFCCMSGDAMGMNMVSKGCLKAIEVIEEHFPDLVLVAISGNFCCDKKPAAVNWIMGRGKSIVVEAVIPADIVKSVLKSNVDDMIKTSKEKCLIGSAMAGSVGGFNAHAANIVAAVFLATGQDPAQVVESANCLTLMDLHDDGESLHVSVTMPSVEVGTVGGGTHLPAQAGGLEICGVRGASKEPLQPGDNARKLAQIVGAAVLAGELSLMAALAANHLVRSHMQHNRKPASTPPVAPTVATEGEGETKSHRGVSGDGIPLDNEEQKKMLARKHASMPDLSN